MIEIIAALIGGGLATVVLMQKYKTQSDVFTIKSDGKINIPSTPPDKVTIKQITPNHLLIQRYNMSGVNSIVVMGSPTVAITRNTIELEADTECSIKGHVMTIIKRASQQSHSKKFNISDKIKNNLKKIDTINYNSEELYFITLKGSGDIYLNNIKNTQLHVNLEGSGDIHLLGLRTGTLTLKLKGSGDIRVDNTSRATATTASIKGSGDININSKSMGVISQSIKGSGDINLKGHYK